MSGRGMNRRGHLSSKIPNVKLRPASSAAPSKKTREADPLNAMDEEMLRRAMENDEDEDVSSAALRSTRKPWQRVVITFTGVEDKPKLADLARQLGADIESALTKDTTHVVASNFGSAKYLYAVEHRIPVMRPEWILSTHERWINAEEVDVVTSMEGMKLLPFTGLTISISGVNAMDRRKQIIKAINDNGGTYAKDLDKTATHLVSAQPTEIRAPSEKVKWAVRELKLSEAARRAGRQVQDEDIKIVYEDWIWDCVGFEGRWKEDWYDARKVRRATRTKYEEVMSGEARDKMLSAVKVEAAVQEEPAILKKRKRDAMDNLVGEIISTATVPKLEFKPTRDDPGEMDIDTETDEPHGTTATEADTPTPASRRPGLDAQGRPISKRKPSILHSSRLASFAGPSKLSREIKLENISASIPATQHPARAALPLGEKVPQTFAGVKCTLLKGANVDAIMAALHVHGAEIVSEEDWRNGERVDYLIVRLAEHVHPDLSGLPEDERPQVGTDCWIEASVYEHRLLPLDDHIVFRPLKGNFPIPGAEKWCVHVAGYEQQQQVFVKRLARAIGITFSDKLNRQTSHLVTSVTSSRKVEKATEWGVAIMRESWVIAMGLSGQLEPEVLHRVRIDGVDDRSEARPSERSAATVVARDEGIKAVKEEPGMEVEPVMEQQEEYHPPAEDGGMDFMADADAALAEEVPPSSRRPAILPSLDFRPPPPVSSPSASAFRKMKPASTPTHIDLIPSTTDRERSMSSTSFPLSPPKAETERRLNHAITSARLQAKPTKDTESIDSKLSRNSSAPVITSSPSAPSKTAATARSTSYPTLGTGRPAMSEMLKLLAQPSDPAISSPAGSSRSNKPVRRPRTSAASASRLRTSMAYSAADGSERGDMTVETTIRFSSSPPPNFGMSDGPGGEMGFDESMRVNYVDPVAEKERKKLFEAMRKGAMKANAALVAENEEEGVEEEVRTKPKSKKRRT